MNNYYETHSSNICLSGVVTAHQLSDIPLSYMCRKTFTNDYNIVYSLSAVCEEKEKPKIQYFAYDDFKYSDVAKRNIKAIFEKIKIKNKEECISIIENLSPEGVENFVKKYVKREIKCSLLKMLRKLKASDPISYTQDCVYW